MKDIILNALSSIETTYDKASFLVKKKLHRLGPFTILPYYGYGNNKTVTIAGRLLEDEGLTHPEKDAEIYEQVAHQYPDKIMAIYIRDVSAAGRDAEVEKIANKLQPQSIPLLACAHTEDAARHAANQGWIMSDLLEEIHQRRVNDEE